MFPYHDENETQRDPYVTIALIVLNSLTWVFVQGAGMPYPLARSVCNLGLIPGELTGALPPGTGLPMGDGLVCVTDPGRQVSHVITSYVQAHRVHHWQPRQRYSWQCGFTIGDDIASHGISVGMQLIASHVPHPWRHT